MFRRSLGIFLRVSADYPWPVGELKVLLGFINTLVLIGSSLAMAMAVALDQGLITPVIRDIGSKGLAAISREAKDHGSNVVYKRLRERGYEVFAINPNADQVEGDPCYHRLSEIAGGMISRGPGMSASFSAA